VFLFCILNCNELISLYSLFIGRINRHGPTPALTAQARGHAWRTLTPLYNLPHLVMACSIDLLVLIHEHFFFFPLPFLKIHSFEFFGHVDVGVGAAVGGDSFSSSLISFSSFSSSLLVGT
jgi:hypothetical protein